MRCYIDVIIFRDCFSAAETTYCYEYSFNLTCTVCTYMCMYMCIIWLVQICCMYACIWQSECWLSTVCVNCSHGEVEGGSGGDRDLHTGLQGQTERSVRPTTPPQTCAPITMYCNQHIAMIVLT